MNKDELKKQIIKTIDENRNKIIEIGKKIYSTPEFGYKEFKTTNTVVDFMKNELTLDVEENIAVTGCRAEINSNKTGPKIALLGELDAISCKDHKDANEIDAIHACGHNIQIAGMLGAAVGLVKSGVADKLDGKIGLMATPAEELIELEYRDNLRKDKKIKFFGGKQELIYRGYFDDVDISIMFHSLDMGENKALVGTESNGFIAKKINFIGKEAHAGSAPHEGINALNAAMLAINNVHAQRETFKESERVRFHPIITKGGNIVNSVPADVRMESYVRARTIEGILDANAKINRALMAGAFAVGAQIEITEIPGYLPILRYRELDNLFKDNLVAIGIAEDKIIDGGDFTGSFDFGDVSQLMPTLHPMIGGIKGSLHSREYEIIDEDLAYITSAKAMALTVVDLLCDNAKNANKILDNFTPKMTKEEYLKLMDSNDKIIKA
ncbi:MULTISPECIES: amidohydrolase [unclassified Clostridium]|uniref:amidohydrolase n=1 Tax=unclassified Clostridium TaxID=2614128 RepID=UPI000EE31BA6|nr:MULTISPECIES: amidohydrolase [unclassified Clostridium]HCQ88841.1 amidohydrolase [Clostridium sp.]